MAQVITDCKHWAPKIAPGHMAYVCSRSIAESILADAVVTPEEGVFHPLCSWKGPGCASRCCGACSHCSPSSCLCLALCQEQGGSFQHRALLFPTCCSLLPYHSCPTWRCPPQQLNSLGSHEGCLTMGWPQESTQDSHPGPGLFLLSPPCHLE